MLGRRGSSVETGNGLVSAKRLDFVSLSTTAQVSLLASQTRRMSEDVASCRLFSDRVEKEKEIYIGLSSGAEASV